ncbi:MAG: hypothetical protein LBR53_13440 [Deltaproteobacteria bacterium]|nr:hypothetical protein [Deltaproteobacteria bacterium]
MKEELKPMLKVYLIDLLSRGGSIFQKDFINPAYKSDKKKELLKLKLISEEKSVLPGHIRTTELKLTENGWKYLENNLSFPLKSGSKSVAVIFSRLLENISANVKSKNISFVDIFTKTPNGLTPEKLLEKIRMISNDHKSLFMPGGGLRISTLVKFLPGASSENIRFCLLELQKQGHLVLYRFDNPGMLTDEDRKALILVAGEPRHYMFIT